MIDEEDNIKIINYYKNLTFFETVGASEKEYIVFRNEQYLFDTILEEKVNVN